MTYDEEQRLTPEELEHLRTEPPAAPAHARSRVMQALKARSNFRSRPRIGWKVAAGFAFAFGIGSAGAATITRANMMTLSLDSAAHAYMRALSVADSAQLPLLYEVFQATADHLIDTSAPLDIREAARFTLRTATEPVRTPTREGIVWF
jgi:hypothetical protein